VKAPKPAKPAKPAEDRGPRCKDWCFTLNNYAPDDHERLVAMYEQHCNYIVFENEIAPGTGTLHLQGFVQFKEQLRLTAVKKCFPGDKHLQDRIHWEPRNGTPAQAANYCKKDAEAGAHVIEKGILSESGKSNDVKRAIATYPTLKELMHADPDLYCRFRNGLRDIYADKLADAPKPRPDVWWIYGATGTGKSTMANLKAKGFTVWSYGLTDGLWFDGYNGQ